MSQAPDFIRDADTSGIQSKDKLDQARKLGLEFFELEEEIEKLEEKLATKKERKLELQHKTLPTLFGDAQIDIIGLPDQNVDIEIKPYYKASISSEWPTDDIKKGFETLEELDGQDIIRAELKVLFMKEEYEDAKELAEFIRRSWPKANSHPVNIDMSVPWMTLTKFVREYSEDETTDPLTEEQLKALGATIGRIAKIKKRKEK